MAAQHDNFDWQTTRDTIRERNKYMFNNSMMSDVTFLVGQGNQIKDIPAHKYVLSISSPVFYPMFFGDMAESKNCVELPDCDADSFLEFLRFVYCDEVNLQANCVLGVLYLGKKYIIPALVKKCLAFLEENLNADNVITVLVHAHRYEETELENRCWELIDREANEVLEGEDFVNATVDVLKSVLSRDTLNVKEVNIFLAVDRWADEVCRRKGIEATGLNKRDVLSGAIELIRFPTMLQQEFAFEVVPKGILEERDCLEMFMKFSSAPTPHLKFSEKPRKFVYEISRCPRFKTTASGWGYSGSNIDGIGFSTNIPISVCGIRLFGQRSFSYSVTIEVRDEKENLLRSVPQKSYISCAGGTHGYIGFDILFERPLRTLPQEKYYVRAKIGGGGSSYYGTNGLTQTTAGDVQFMFHGYQASNNGTGVSQGQVYEVLFYKS